jgi:MFS family permease
MSEAMPETGLARRLPPVLRQRNFRLYFTGQSLSIVGDAIVPVALAFAVLDLGGDPSDLGLVLGAGILPSVLLVLMGGVVADRVERRRLMLLCDVTRVVSQGLQGVLLLTGHTNLAVIIVLQLVWGSASAFFRPGATGFIAEVVEPTKLQQANGLVGLSENVAYMIGPVISGVLVATAGPGAALLADAGTFAASALALSLVRSPARPRAEVAAGTSLLADLVAGWHEFRSRSWLWSMVLWAASFHLLALPAMLVLGPAVAQQHLGGSTAWATIATGSGVGAVIGGIVALRYRPRYLLRASFLPLGLYGLALVALGVPLPTLVIAAAAVLGGIGAAMFNVYLFTAIQQQVPLHAVSRVTAYDWLGSIAMLPVGQALIGPAAAVTSTRTMLTVAGLWMLISPAVLYLVRSARNLEAVRSDASAPLAEPA